MQITKSFTVEVPELNEAGLQAALRSLRLTIQDFAIAMKADPAVLDRSLLLETQPTIAMPDKSIATRPEASKPPSKPVAAPVTKVVAPEKAEPARVQSGAGTETTKASDANLPTDEQCLEAVFKDLKRTVKSEEILTAIIEAKDPISTSDVASAIGQPQDYLSAWLVTTGKRIPQLEKPKRGIVWFNRSKLKV